MSLHRNVRKRSGVVAAAMVLLACLPRLASQAMAQDKKPNILVIMGDDIGWFNLGSYNQGIMLEATPNLHRISARTGGREL